MSADHDHRQTVLIVDDVPDNIDLLASILRSDYRCKAATSGQRALEIARAQPQPDLILLDIMMPEMDGYEVCRQLKADPATKAIPVIFASALNEIDDECRGLELGAVDYITKPVTPAIVLARVRTQLALYDHNRELEREVRGRTEELQRSRLEIIRRLGRAAEFKDNETGLHVIRMSHYSHLLAVASGGNEEWAELLLQASPMHDIGKIGIPDRILLKPGKLDAAEWALMQRHAEFGVKIIGEHDSALLATAREIALSHHEKWDGSGYPSGLSGTGIPLSGRIAAIADVFDALTSERPYKRAWPVEEAVGHVVAGAGSHFDPTLVHCFQQVLPQLLAIKDRYAEESASTLTPDNAQR